MDDDELRCRLQRLLREGRLPRVRGHTLLASYGTGAPCAICELSMTTAEVVYELRFASGSEVTPFSVHFRCFDAWEQARDQFPVAAT